MASGARRRSMSEKKLRKPKTFVPIRPKGRGTIPMKDIIAAVERVFRARESKAKAVGSAS